MENILRRYNNWYAFLKYTTQDKQTEFDKESRISDKNHNEWAGTPNFETAIKLARTGWPKGLDKIRELKIQIDPIISKYFPKLDYSEELYSNIVGGAVNIGNYINGVPDCMINFKPNYESLKEGKILQRFIIGAGHISNINHDTIFNRGACIVSLVEAMLKFGWQLELWYSHTVQKGNDNFYTSQILLKEFDQPADIDKLAFAFAHPSMLRRLIFSSEELESKDIIKKFGFYSGAGYSATTSWDKYKIESTDIYIPVINENKTQQEIINEMLALINQAFQFKQKLAEE